MISERFGFYKKSEPFFVKFTTIVDALYGVKYQIIRA